EENYTGTENQTIFFYNYCENEIVVCRCHIITYIRLTRTFAKNSTRVNGKFCIIGLCNALFRIWISMNKPVDSALNCMNSSNTIRHKISKFIDCKKQSNARSKNQYHITNWDSSHKHHRYYSCKNQCGG